MNAGAAGADAEAANDGDADGYQPQLLRQHCALSRPAALVASCRCRVATVERYATDGRVSVCRRVCCATRWAQTE